jgi:O-antigen/teichoic acid export membrane protein
LRRGVRSSLLLGGAAAVVLGVGAPLVLSLLGSGYAAEGVGPLRILVVAVVPLTFVHMYFATCRATGHLGEATATGWISGVVAVVAAALVAPPFGLTGMAVAWLAVQLATGAWAAVRLRGLHPPVQLPADVRAGPTAMPGVGAAAVGPAPP